MDVSGVDSSWKLDLWNMYAICLWKDTTRLSIYVRQDGARAEEASRGARAPASYDQQEHRQENIKITKKVPGKED